MEVALLAKETHQ